MDAEEISIIPMDDVDGPSITLDIDGVDTIGDDGPSAPKSVNFGPGVELLMNDKKKVESSTPTADISLGDLDALEKELGEGEAPKPSLREARSNIFAFQNPKKGGDVSEPDAGAGAEEIKINMSQPATPSIAKTLGGGGKSDQTWDGYGKFKDVPLGPEAKPEPKLTPKKPERKIQISSKARRSGEQRRFPY